jgi:hypothetical protein
MDLRQELSDESAKKAADETAIVTKFYYYHDPARKAAAREALRRVLRYSELSLLEDRMADTNLEAIWNALVND